MIKKILLVVAGLIVVFLIVVAAQPSEYRVTRTATISAPQDEVFNQVNDLHKFHDWSPWSKLDPNMKTTFEGPASGTGAINTWSGNKAVGEGRMTIRESRPNDLVRMKLEFIKPFPSTADVDFTFKPEGNGTSVTWGMAGQKNFMSKAFCLFMNMDKMVGGDFERGLANLKSVCEQKKREAK